MQSKIYIIIGGSGSGKTTVGEYLHNQKPDNVEYIDLDDFYKEEKNPETANFDLPSQYNWLRLKICFNTLKQGEYFVQPKYDSI
jgi:uridine kinase